MLRKSWQQFTSHLEKIKPNRFKLLKHMKKDIGESANINAGPRKETFLHYYKKLWATLFKKLIGIKKCR
jgi:hypothetical protein